MLSGIAQSAHKMATDLRLLAHRKEIEEPFEKEQIGSSAMAYKRNPMRSERICSLARFVMSLETSAAATAAVQWLERTLDDSANRRLVLPQSFLATDAVLILCQNVTTGLVVYPRVIAANLEAELPFMATENILMAAVAAGGDRQDVARADPPAQPGRGGGGEEAKAARTISWPGSPPIRPSRKVDLCGVLDASKFVGRAPEQVDEFIGEIVEPIRAKYGEQLAADAELGV